MKVEIESNEALRVLPERAKVELGDAARVVEGGDEPSQVESKVLERRQVTKCAKEGVHSFVVCQVSELKAVEIGQNRDEGRCGFRVEM